MINKDKNFLQNYYQLFQKKLINNTDKNFSKIIKLKNLISNTNKKGKKIIVFGNGGSASIASHFSVDLTKNSGIRCVNFNEYDLITCFSNDFGYENWIFKAVEYYGDKGDLLILISSSGMSKNIINGCKIARKKRMKVVTLSGFQKTNFLSKKRKTC